MSWLTDFTSKAESFLNKIDQSTGSALNESGLVKSNQPEHNEHIGEINIVKAPPLITEQQVQIKSTPPISPINKSFDNSNYRNVPNSILNSVSPDSIQDTSNLTRSNSTPSLQKKKNDDLLFEFLNSNTPPAKTIVRKLSDPKTSTPWKDVSHAIAITAVSTIQQQVAPQITQNLIIKTSNDVLDAPTVSSELLDSIPQERSLGDAVSTVQSKMNEAAKKNDDRISNLELENKLLKNEMHVLNEELSSTLKNLKDQQQETEKYKLRYENRRTQQNFDYEKIQKQYESKISDYEEALKAKDSQLAVLRVRIDDADAALQAKINTLEDLQSKQELMLKDHSNASGVQGDALVNLKHKLESVECQLRQEQTENNNIKSELMNLQTKLQTEQHQYAETIKQLQSRQSEGKDKSRELEIKTKSAEEAAETSRRELKEYKDKAARILQAKEKLIASLRQGTDSTDFSPALLSEIEELKQDRDSTKEELQQSRYRMQQMQSELQDLELLHDTETNDNNQKIDSLQLSLQGECQKRRNAEEDMKRYMQELQFTREDLNKLKRTQITDRQEHEATTKKLLHQLSAKAQQTANSSQEELENRIRTLTNSLIQKQTMLEAIGTEKNSLVLQLERLEKQYRDIENSLNKRNKGKQHDVEDPESGSNLQPIASIMPSQITQNKRWKKTVNDIDKFSIRLGVFLRRYPIARLMVIFYMIMLHFWVTFVLLTYTPEIHPVVASD